MMAGLQRRLGRTGRYVRKSRWSVGPSAPMHRLAFLAEESLRLCSLPGEREGRVYYFRHLRVSGLREDGDRRSWFDAFQRALQTQATQAIHGSNPSASRADAVFFRNELEACELVLAEIVARRTANVWFWPHVTGVPEKSTAAAQVIGVIERLLATQASWTAVAAAVFSTIRRTNSIALLKLLPAQALARWLQLLGVNVFAVAPAPVSFPIPIVRAIMQAIDSFGPDAAPVLWLATLAVVAISPSTATNGAAVQIARASLLRVLHGSSIPRTGRTEKEAFSSLPQPVQEGPVADSLPEAIAQRVGSKQEPMTPALREFCYGEPTSGAGLFFLLNVLTRLGIADQEFSLLFLARLFLRIARHAGIEEGDPILLWAEITRNESEPEEIPDRRLRLWLIKIRRWCWRNGRITVREIVRRHGYVTLTRTDLDVSLSIDSADIRIRRIGLDLDPGWVPWFGRVVRFHYRYRGERHE